MEERIQIAKHNRTRWLRRAGLIVGLVGVVVMMIFFLAVGEAPFSMYAVPAMLMISFPFLVMVGIAWKWSVTGGILLITASLFWPVWRLSTLPTIPPISIIAFTVLPVSLILLISGVLFLCSRKEGHKR